MSQSVVLGCSSGEDLSCQNMQGGDILVIPWENKEELKSKALAELHTAVLYIGTS